MIGSAWSVLPETEEPAVLNHFSWNRNRNGTDFFSILGTERIRNRSLKPRVPETANSTEKWAILLLFDEIFSWNWWKREARFGKFLILREID